ncbi:MAG: hypothetical protein JWM80_708 [Cyanobacteria bacterium RYN_339]|nr:hypothetical protein [Cyanobacteria bacterium RYN_339]
MTSDDMFRLFEANANGMEEFARLSGEASIRRRLPRPAAPVPVALMEQMEEEPRRSWLERMGLVQVPKKTRRRLTAMPQGLVGASSQTS